MSILSDLEDKIKQADSTLDDLQISPVIPITNADGQTYKTVRGEDFREVFSSTDIQKTNIINYIRLLMPKYTRRVQVEDINKNTWVIGNCISTIIETLFHNTYGIEKIWEELNRINDLEDEINTLKERVDGGELVSMQIDAPEYSLQDIVKLSDISITLNSTYGDRKISLSDINVKELIQNNGDNIKTAYKSKEQIFVYYDDTYYTYSCGVLSTTKDSYLLDNLYGGSYSALLPKLVFKPSKILTNGEILFVHIGEVNPAYVYMGGLTLSAIKSNSTLVVKNLFYYGLGVQQNYQLYENNWIKYDGLITPKRTNLFSTQQTVSGGKYIRTLKNEVRNNIFVEFFRPESDNMVEKYTSATLGIDVFFANLTKENLTSVNLQKGNILDGDLSLKATSQAISKGGLGYCSTIYPLVNPEGLAIYETYNLFAKGSHIGKTKGVGSGKWWSEYFVPSSANSPYYYANEDASLPNVVPISYINKIESVRTGSGDWQLSSGEVELPSIIPFGITPSRYALKGVKIERLVLTSTDERGRCPSDIKLIGIIGNNTLDTNMTTSNSVGTKRYNVSVGYNQDGVYSSTSTKLFASSATIDKATTNYWQDIPLNKWNNTSATNPYSFILDSGSLNMGYFYNFCLVGMKDNGSNYQKSFPQIGYGNLYVTAENALPFYPKLESDF